MNKKLICCFLINIMIFTNSSLMAEELTASQGENKTEVKDNTEEYKLQPEDVMRVSVWGYPDMERLIGIPPDGLISLPPIEDKIQVVNLTVSALENLLVEKFSKYLKDIKRVQVYVQEYRGNRIFILGQVLQPGQYTFAVIPNVLEVITRAGGGTIDASLRGVRILRGNLEKSEVILVDLDKYLQTGDNGLLPKLKSGDTVYVPRLGEEGKLIDERKRGESRRKAVNIIGEVRGPGVYTLDDSIDLIEAISRAGGSTPFADLNKIKIISYQGDIPVIKNVVLNDYMNKGDLMGNPIIKPGDTIIVPTYVYEGLLHPELESKANVVYVLGEVYKPGSYQLGSNKNVWNIVQLAGGVTDEAYLNKIKIIKGEGNQGYPNTIKLDLTENLTKSDFSNLPSLESRDTVVIPKKTHFWRDTVKLFSEIAVIVGVINLFNK